MNKIINASTKQVSDRYGVIPIGRGCGEKDNKSKKESVSFQLQRKLTKEEARILIVDIIELFLRNINNNQEITHFLYDHPFTYKNLEFRVFVYNEDGSDIYHPNVGLVSLTQRDTIKYATYKLGTMCEYETSVDESYEEAYKIVTGRDYSTLPPE